MKVFVISAVILLFFAGCKESGSVKKTEVTTDISAPSDTTKKELTIDPQDIDGVPGQVTFRKNEKTIFYFTRKNNKGKIIVSGKEYLLNKLDYDSQKAQYTLSGGGIIISTSSGKFKEDAGGDCFYAVFPTVTVKLNSNSVVLSNVDLQDCPSYE